MLVKPRYFEHGNQPSLFGSRDLVPVMPRLGVWHPSAKNRGFGTPGSVQAPNYGESRGLVPRFLPTSAIWFPGSGETPGREKRAAPFRVPNLEIRPRAGTKPRILPRKGTEPPDFASISPSRGTKPPISAVLFFFIGYQIAHLARMPAKRGTKPRKLAQTTAGFALRRMHSTDA